MNHIMRKSLIKGGEKKGEKKNLGKNIGKVGSNFAPRVRVVTK